MFISRVIRWTTRLHRKTTSGHWLPEIDGLRFIAIFAVLFFHIQGQFDHHYSLAIHSPFAVLVRASSFGNRGVQLFFVISGFILALPFARHYLFSAQAPSLRRFYLRRITRLEPPYVLNLILVTAGVVVVSHSSWREMLPHLAASMFYLHNAVFHTTSPINFVLWSLEVEAQFYLLAPLFMMLFLLRPVAVRRTILVAIILVSAALQDRFGLTMYTLAGDLQYFFAGLLLADFYLGRTADSPGHPKSARFAWDLLSLMGWPAFFLLGSRFAGLWLPMLALMLCLAAMRGNVITRLLRWPAIAITGGMCYTIYLWHAPIFTLVDRALRAHPALLPSNYLGLYLEEAAVKLAVVALVCVPLFILIERPCMDPQWLPRLAARMRRQGSSGDVPVPNRAS
jgi:peptidoglycan/LPS O-acetylase OafA/YrhL